MSPRVFCDADALTKQLHAVGVGVTVGVGVAVGVTAGVTVGFTTGVDEGVGSNMFISTHPANATADTIISVATIIKWDFITPRLLKSEVV